MLRPPFRLTDERTEADLFRLRSDARLAATRIVALTGYGQPADKERARRAGFDAHLVKPLDFDALERILAEDGPPAPQLHTAV